MGRGRGECRKRRRIDVVEVTKGEKQYKAQLQVAQKSGAVVVVMWADSAPSVARVFRAPAILSGCIQVPTRMSCCSNL